MKTLTEIKNTYAQEQECEDWDDLANSVQDDLEYEQHWTEICIRAQKAALEKAAENVEVKIEKSYTGSMGNEFGQLYETYIVVDKESITNEQNLIR